MHEVDETVSEAEYAAVERALTAAGFEHYEVSNYAREGFRARHNSSYWHGAQYLGIGPGRTPSTARCGGGRGSGPKIISYGRATSRSV